MFTAVQSRRLAAVLAVLGLSLFAIRAATADEKPADGKPAAKPAAKPAKNSYLREKY